MNLFHIKEPFNEKKEIPDKLLILPLRNTVVFPYSVMPVAVNAARSEKLVEDAMKGNRLIGLVAARDSSIEEPGPEDLYETGTMVSISQAFHGSDNKTGIIVQGLERFRIEEWLDREPYLRAKIRPAKESTEPGVELEALTNSVKDLAKEMVNLSPDWPDNIAEYIDQIKDPLYLAYMTAANHGMDREDAQKLLEKEDTGEKLRMLISFLSHQREILKLGKKIKSEAKETMDKAQKEFFLRQQMKAIKQELGESEDAQPESVTQEYEEKIKKAGLPEEAEKEARRELKRLAGMPPHAAEYPVIKTYLDLLTDLPWNTLSEEQLDLERARAILDEDHYNMQEVKDRLIEYLAVRKLSLDRGVKAGAESEGKTGSAKGAILCLTGPPGVGKTSLGQSIARALGRKFTRMSLGGMRDEAEIRGHRRTYIGAMAGRIIQGIKRAGTRNPVFMLDEVDKVGSDWRGDPSSALLEVLDPAQNHTFRDHYLDVDFDLSEVIFITTANQLDSIPSPLRDRMEVITLEGYTEYEKVRIAENYLVPRQIGAHGINSDEISFTRDALSKIIKDYTREAGVRNLERQIGTICRKVVVGLASGKTGAIEITPDVVREYLKKEKFESEASETITIPGIATGLAVTATGGDILFIEATKMPGKGRLRLTGQLGDVMRESAEIAYSYVRAKTEDLGLHKDLVKDEDVHVHVPAGAIPKDGPSAGVAMVMAMISLFTGRKVRSKLGMTGEVTLRGRVMPVGGIKMKVLAAHRAGLNTVILPKRNEKDLDELPDEIRNVIHFVLVDRIEDAIPAALTLDEESEMLSFGWFYDQAAAA